MRLIDADALMKSMYHRAFETDGDTMWQSGCWVRYRAIEQVVKEQPTIEGRKTGRWIEDAETYYKAVNEKGYGVDENTPYFTEDDIACPVCFAMFSVIDNETERFDFCPGCGADLREEGGQ